MGQGKAPGGEWAECGDWQAVGGWGEEMRPMVGSLHCGWGEMVELSLRWGHREDWV